MEEPHYEQEDAKSSLPPFEIPADYEFEDEFHREPPRPIPLKVKRGYRVRSKLRIAAVLCLTGAVLVQLDHVDFVETLSNYFLPLRYLDWIGFIAVASGIYFYAEYWLGFGQTRYIKTGVPCVARVINVVPEINLLNGVPNQLTYAVDIEVQHPNTREIATCTTKSDPINLAFSKLELYECSLTLGDYVTAVYLPGKFEKTLRLYGLMQLSQETDFILKQGSTKTKIPSILESLAIAAVLLALFTLAIGMLYMTEFHWPLEDAEQIGWAGATGAVALLPIGVLVWLSRRKKPKKLGQSGLLMLLFLSAGGGFLLGMVAAILINSFADTSTPDLRYVEIVEYWEETTNFIIRSYELEYRQLGAADTKKFATTVGWIEHFFDTDLGVMDLREGALGMPWISNINPVVGIVDENTLIADEDISQAMSFHMLTKDGLAPLPPGMEHDQIWKRFVYKDELKDYRRELLEMEDLENPTFAE